MANVTTLAAGGTSGSAVGSTGPRKITHEINLADAVSAGLTTTGLVYVVQIPADTYFRLLQVEVVNTVVLGGSARLDLGDTADDDEFVSNATSYAAGTNLTLLKGDGSSGDVYTASSIISLKVTGDAVASATGLIRFVWLQMDTARNAPADTD